MGGGPALLSRPQSAAIKPALPGLPTAPTPPKPSAKLASQAHLLYRGVLGWAQRRQHGIMVSFDAARAAVTA